MHYWLMKTEPDVFSLDDLKARGARGECWNGVRNYQARNYMRQMQVGDGVLCYHSNCAPPGVAGVMRVSRVAYADPTAWDAASPYADPRSTPAKPLWDMVDVVWVETFPRYVNLDTLRGEAALAGMQILQRGNRLSVTPVSDAQFRHIRALGGTRA